MKIYFRSLIALSILGLTLIACNPVPIGQHPIDLDNEQNQFVQAAEDTTDDSPDLATSPSTSLEDGQVLSDDASAPREMAVWPDGQIRIDQQGAVEIAMVPVNLNNPQDTLDFEVSLNTHSVDLSMDLAVLTSLRTDSGLEVKASAWNGPLGGHHVSGILSFPSTLYGEGVLEGAQVLELTVINLDAPERVFIWER